MPISTSRAPTELERLRPYIFHGVGLTSHGSHATGDCPFCGREGKFSVDITTGLWRCFVCGTGTNNGGGNGLVFVRLLYERSRPQNRLGSPVPRPPGPNGSEPMFGPRSPVNAAVGVSRGIPGGFLEAVAADRRPASPSAAAAWGVAQARDGAWLVPGYSTAGRLDQVYRRMKVKERDGWVWRLLPTPGIWPEGKVHALHLPIGDFDPARPKINVMEGPWDGMSYWEFARSEDGNVIAVPGCNVWRDEWTELCRGKHVTLWFDSDHPRTFGSKTVRAGYDGMCRVARRLSGIAASVRWIRWGRDGYDPTRPSGWDVRDYLIEADNKQAAVMELLSKVEPVPPEWFLPIPSANGSVPHSTNLEALPCCKWSECEASWDLSKGGAMYWRRDLGDALATLLAICASTSQPGNQLFLDLIGAPGSAKTTLCRGLLVSRHCVQLENMTKIITGWKDPQDGSKDCSFLARSNNKTWVTCEFDVLGSSPQYRELMGKVRRIFDGETSATYGNSDQDRLYTTLRTPWIRAGTPRMMNRMTDYDQSQLGDRFLRLIIGDPDSDERRDIARAAVRLERAAVIDRVNGMAGSIEDPKTRRAQALTGGYVDWLRANVEEKIALVDIDNSAEDRCIDLAELSADMRARPNEDRRKKEVHDSKEMPTRLARQNVRLALCLAVVLNKRSVDAEVLRIVRKVALDTAHGYSLDIVRWLCSPNPKANGVTYQECGGLMEGTLAMWTGMTPDRLLNYLVFLRKIGVLRLERPPQSNGAWLLTERVHSLYLRVMNG